MAVASENRLVQTIIALNIVSALAQLSQMGIIYPLVSIWLASKNVSASEIGLVGSMQWVGMLGGLLYAPFGMFRTSARTMVLIGCLGTAVIACMMPHIAASAIWLWCVASAAIGFGVGLRWIGNESWLYSIISGAQRGRIVGIHETLIHISQTVGPILIAWIGVTTDWGFYSSAFFAACAVLPFFWAHEPMPTNNLTVPVSIAHFAKVMWHHAQYSIGVQLGFLAGLIDGVLFGMLAVYEVKGGASAAEAAIVMTVFGAGGLLSSAPLGWLSDARGVRYAAVVASLVGIAGAILLWANQSLLHWPAVFLLGVVAGCMLTLAIIAVTEHAANHEKDMSIAMGEISIAFTIGTIIGPIMTGAAMDNFGLWTLPALTIFLCAAVLLLMRLKRQP